MTASHNKNAKNARRALQELGATVLSIEHGAKHAIVRFVTAAGVHGKMQVSMGRATDPYIMAGWVRQAVTRADGRVEHAQQLVQRRCQ